MLDVDLKAPDCRRDDTPVEMTADALREQLCAGRVLVAGTHAAERAVGLLDDLGLPLKLHVDERRAPDAWELF